MPKKEMIVVNKTVASKPVQGKTASSGKIQNPPEKRVETEIVTRPPRIPSTFGQRAADRLTEIGGSWGFILSFFIFIGIWMALNLVAWMQHWDPYPFILLNLCLSCLAAIQAPIILMSQNREAQRDRLRSEYDYAVNRKAEREIEEIRAQLDRIEKRLR